MDDETTCKWNIFDDTSKVVLGLGLCVSGIISVILNGWLLLTFFNGRLLTNRSHLMLLNLCCVSLFKNMFGGFLFTGTSAIAKGWLFGQTGCNIFAFISHFLGVFQIEALTHMCIERYVLAKYTKNGWEVSLKYYALFVGLCWFFATAYSLPTLVGLGRFDCEPSGVACALDLSAEGWLAWVNLAFILLAGAKPILVMATMLLWAVRLEKEFYKAEKHAEQIELTKSTIYVSCAMVWFWLPQWAVWGTLVAPQILGGTLAAPPTMLVFLASFMNELAGALPMVVFLWTNITVRRALLSLFGYSHCKEN